jgi:signal transduction histidine kinase
MMSALRNLPARLPIRVRVTAAFAAVLTLLLVGLGFLAYRWMDAALLDEIDSGLRFRAAATTPIGTPASGASEAGRSTIAQALPDPRLQEAHEAFGQLLTPNGRVLRASAGLTAPLLSAAQIAAISRPTFFQRHVPNLAGPARLLAVPSSTDSTLLVVGASMSDRTDALRRLGEIFVIGGPAAIALAWLASWVVAGSALRPVERMRQQASAITASGPDRRLTVPAARDELRWLAETLNDMLDRLDGSLIRERAFIEHASHELRTPLAALRAEVDLSLRRERSAEELTAALRSVSQETDRLAQLAEDLLVLARAADGRLPLHRQDIPLRATLESAAALFAARALEGGLTLSVDAPDIPFNADPLRLRQALVNLLDNALRHTPRHGTVRLTAAASGTDIHIAVSDTGPGIDGAAADGGDQTRSRPGLGLRIVRAIAAGHHGSVHIGRNLDGGTTVQLTLPGGSRPAQRVLPEGHGPTAHVF